MNYQAEKKRLETALDFLVAFSFAGIPILQQLDELKITGLFI